MVVKNKGTGGGFKDISVKVKKAEKKAEGEIAEEPIEEPIEEPVEGEPGAENTEVNMAIVETICVAGSRIAVAITGIEEIALDEAEIEQLKNLWSSLVPEVSPTAAAIIGTLIIVGGKVGIYVAKRKTGKKVKSAKSNKPPKTKQDAETKE